MAQVRDFTFFHNVKKPDYLLGMFLSYTNKFEVIENL